MLAKNPVRQIGLRSGCQRLDAARISARHSDGSDVSAVTVGSCKSRKPAIAKAALETPSRLPGRVEAAIEVTFPKISK